MASLGTANSEAEESAEAESVAAMSAGRTDMAARESVADVSTMVLSVAEVS